VSPSITRVTVAAVEVWAQTEALAAAQAEHRRLSAHADAVAATRAGVDADTETLRRLAALRSGIAERVGTAAARDLPALRAAIASVFSASYLVPEDELYASQASVHGELHARLDADHDDDDDAALVLERADGGWRERPSRRLAFVPSVREELLREPDALAFPDPVRTIPLPLAGNNATATQVLDQIRTSPA